MIKKIKTLILVVFLNTFAYANFSIKAKIIKCIENTPVTLLQYNYGESEITKTVVKSETFSFENLDNLTNGVYSIIINYQSHTFNNKQTIYKFDIIIDKSEKVIEIEFNPSQEELPKIIKSKINNNYYKYLNSEHNKINGIEKLQLISQSNIKPLLNSTKDFNDILEKKIKEINESKKKYIKKNFNKWSTALVKNSTNMLKINNISKNKYWCLFQTNNPDLINTPVFQQIIQYYTIEYYNNADEEGYKEAFHKIIQQFSENKMVKKWAIKYMITGLSQIGNKNLEAYFSEIYKCKI
jgi:hypothetical protein